MDRRCSVVEALQCCYSSRIDSLEPKMFNVIKHYNNQKNTSCIFITDGKGQGFADASFLPLFFLKKLKFLKKKVSKKIKEDV